MESTTTLATVKQEVRLREWATTRWSVRLSLVQLLLRKL